MFNSLIMEKSTWSPCTFVHFKGCTSNQLVLKKVLPLLVMKYFIRLVLTPLLEH